MALASALASIAACEGDIGGENKEVPGPPDVEPKAVPTSLDKVESAASCSPLRANETLLAVSPEGHAWLVVPGEVASLRVLDAFGAEMTETVDDIHLTDIQDALAWSGVDAALIANEGLWRLDDLARIELTPPEGFVTPASACGNPSENGVIVSNGSVFEMHDDGQWWAWKPDLAGAEAPNHVIRFDGECQSSKNIMWLTSEDGTLFEVDPAEYARPVRFAKLVDSAATEDKVFILESDQLWVGPEKWQPWTFEGAMPKALTASNGKLWFVWGDRLVQTDGEDFVEITHGLGGAIQKVAAHSNGAWVVGDTQICHQSVGPMIRMEGLHPNARDIEFDYAVRVRADVEGATLTAELDGTPVALTADADPLWSIAEFRLNEVGWHTLTLTAEAAGKTTKRIVDVKLIPETVRSWKVDVEPIYAANCANSTCHKPGAPKAIDLGSYELWKENATDIRTRVVKGKTMPPPANKKPEWSETQIEVISQWLEGGMQP
jgi:hypothetical protein